MTKFSEQGSIFPVLAIMIAAFALGVSIMIAVNQDLCAPQACASPEAVEARQDLGAVLMRLVQTYEIREPDTDAAIAAIHQYVQTHDDSASLFMSFKLDAFEAALDPLESQTE